MRVTAERRTLDDLRTHPFEERFRCTLLRVRLTQTACQRFGIESVVPIALVLPSDYEVRADSKARSMRAGTAI